MSHTVINTHYPTRFRGVFASRRSTYAPHIAAARQRLAAYPVPEALRPWYTYMIIDNPQPSFLLLPLMFLAVADDTGGITPRHEEYLPVLMLAMEACALMDDTVDRTRMRSDRPTFPHQFGDVSATPMLATLLPIITQETARVEPRLIQSVTNLFLELGALELWEYQHRYPADAAAFNQWLTHRYAEVTPAVIYAFEAALLLNDRPTLPASAAQAFAEVFQDVDDIVNLREQRQAVGENDDLKMGMVTHPLLASIDEPEVRPALRFLWDHYRTLQFLPRNDLMRHIAKLDAQPALRSAYAVLQTAVERVGVPATIAKIATDADRCVNLSPPFLQPLMQELVAAFVERLADQEERLADALYRSNIHLRTGNGRF